MPNVKECISPTSSHSDQKSDGILVSGKCDYESGCGSKSFLVGASKQQAVSFREAYGRSGSEDDNASGVGYDPPGDDRGDTFGCDPPRDNSSGAEAPSTIKGINQRKRSFGGASVFNSSSSSDSNSSSSFPGSGCQQPLLHQHSWP